MLKIIIWIFPNIQKKFGFLHFRGFANGELEACVMLVTQEMTLDSRSQTLLSFFRVSVWARPTGVSRKSA
jgi:hypothetical protein